MTEPILELEFEKYEKVIEKQAKDLEEKDAEIEALKKRIAEMEAR